MLDELFNWLWAALPWQVQIGCLIMALLAIGGILLWGWHAGWLEG